MNKNVFEIIDEVASKIYEKSYAKYVFLYGSYSKGTYNEDSDVDIAVFIDENSVSILDEYKRIAFLCRGYDVDIQPQVFSVKELNEPIGIIEEIVKFGKIVR